MRLTWACSSDWQLVLNTDAWTPWLRQLREWPLSASDSVEQRAADCRNVSMVGAAAATYDRQVRND